MRTTEHKHDDLDHQGDVGPQLRRDTEIEVEVEVYNGPTRH